jgi:membrane associated rhomboid family serine protease
MLLPLGDDLERPNFPVATVALIFLNVAVFAVTYRMELTEEFLLFPDEPGYSKQEKEFGKFYRTWGAVPELLADGQVIGLLTHMFLHASILHLVGNMLILWVFGQSLETALGTLAYLVLYVFWGVLACLAHAATDFSSEIYMVGASGAIAGVLGGYVVMFGYSARIRMLFLLGAIPFRFGIPAWVFGSLWILEQMYSASIDATGHLTGVAWTAHVGGFGAGCATMLVFRRQTDRVLCHEGDSLVFRSRNELEEPASALADPGDETGEGGATGFAEQPCSGCGAMLGADALVGDRLLKCPDGGCGRLNYLVEPAMARA